MRIRHGHFLNRLLVAGQQEVERVKGIEPSYAAWEAAVLPLNYTRVKQNCKRFLPMPQ